MIRYADVLNEGACGFHLSEHEECRGDGKVSGSERATGYQWILERAEAGNGHGIQRN